MVSPTGGRMTVWVLSILVAASAALHLRAEYRGPRAQVYVFKPLTTIAILAVALVRAPEAEPVYAGAIAVGLLFSLAGDVFLMLPKDRFLAGLASFAVAHGAYVFAFAQGPGPERAWSTAVPVAAYSAVLVVLLWPHLGRLRPAVLLYAALIGAMLWTALERWRLAGGPEGADPASALLAAAGAVLFVLSDSALAWNRFRQPFAAAQLAVLGTYFPAQWLIALSVGA